MSVILVEKMRKLINEKKWYEADLELYLIGWNRIRP